ncbi:sensor histidine kinase [Eionea flava]
MAQANKNYSRRWLSNTKTAEQSLRTRLLIRISCLFLIVWITTTITTKLLVKEGSRNYIYEHTQQSASHWVNILSHQKIDALSLSESGDQFTTIWQDNNIVIDQNILHLKKPTRTETYLHEHDNKRWIISTHCQHNTCAAVGFKDSERRHAARRLVASISIPLLLIFLATTAGIYFSIRSGLRPLNELATAVSNLPENTQDTVHEKVTTKELIPLVKAINQLIHNLRNQLEKERQFLDTCSHEIRTPITALIAQIQSVNFEESSQKLSHIKKSALRTIRVANQVISLAKNRNRQLTQKDNSIFDICELTRLIISDLLNTDQHINITMQGENNLTVDADPLAIEVLLRNIIDNAFKYGKNNKKIGTILININQIDRDTIISIEDSGYGVNDSEKKYLLEKFYRGKDNQSDGAGLGLSIAHAIVEAYHGKILLEDSIALGGLKITLTLTNIQHILPPINTIKTK